MGFSWFVGITDSSIKRRRHAYLCVGIGAGSVTHEQPEDVSITQLCSQVHGLVPAGGLRRHVGTGVDDQLDYFGLLCPQGDVQGGRLLLRTTAIIANAALSIGSSVEGVEARGNCSGVTKVEPPTCRFICIELRSDI